ncbi:MAG: SGNH/GDSL hydrolase family protein [Firmicutes bacterium]|nr:SGNH/GDSL hydrolase family protein [Bacillota bacterium]
MGKFRAESHNKLFEHKQSLEENQEILNEFVHYLHTENVLPIVVITPFTEAYNRYVLPEMKEAVLQMLDNVPEEVHFVDFNDASYFTDADFMDTDHLNENGAKKMSRILAELFGK